MDQGSGQHILIVDDEPMLARVAKRFLERIGYRVTTCPGPVEALEMARENHCCNLVITDLAMPAMTGLEFGRRLREIDPGIPIILMTGYSADLTLDTAKKAGFATLLHKPVMPEALATAIRQALETNGSEL